MIFFTHAIDATVEHTVLGGSGTRVDVVVSTLTPRHFVPLTTQPLQRLTDRVGLEGGSNGRTIDTDLSFFEKITKKKAPLARLFTSPARGADNVQTE